jgi:UDP-3-O-acyl N-acetylglucosamine deacetylase
MVEHLLAALAGLRIDNCEIWVDAAEMPGIDGSCQDAVQVLQQAGIVEQDLPRQCLKIEKVVRVGNADQWIEARPADRLILKYDMDFGRSTAIGRRELEWVADDESFATEIAPARTFILKSSAEMLRAQGLGLRTSHRDLLVFDDHGPMENELRFDDECVRHKILDLVGDMALSGCDIQGYILAHRSGHRLNAALVRALHGGRAWAFQQRDTA